MIATQAPSFHSLTGTQPVGQTQIATQADYAGTITSVRRVNADYWVVRTRTATGAFTPDAEAGSAAYIWKDRNTGGYVVDYWVDGIAQAVVADDHIRSLRAAIGIAADVTAQRYAESVATR